MISVDLLVLLVAEIWNFVGEADIEGVQIVVIICLNFQKALLLYLVDKRLSSYLLVFSVGSKLFDTF